MPRPPEDRLQTSDLRLQTSDFRLQTSDFRLQASGSGLQASGFRLQTSGFRLQTSGSGLQTSDFRLQTSDFRLRASDFRLQASDCEPLLAEANRPQKQNYGFRACPGAPGFRSSLPPSSGSRLSSFTGSRFRVPDSAFLLPLATGSWLPATGHYSAAMIASAIWLVPTAVGSSRLGFMS